MAPSKLTIISSLTITFALLLTFGALPAQAQIIIIPDCDENPQHEFCQGQCQFVEPLPSWCEPPEPETDPVVIVPGMLSSVNFKATFQDEEGGAWDFFPYFGNVYRGLTERLEAAGFTEGQDLFIAHYDWRQSNDESANEYLKPVIDQAKQISGADKVDIIAHSMGGLVARSYIQGPSYDNDVDQLITLGTPHLGAADAYVAWEGGQMPERWGPWIKLYVSIVEDSLQISHKSYLSALRRQEYCLPA